MSEQNQQNQPEEQNQTQEQSQQQEHSQEEQVHAELEHELRQLGLRMQEAINSAINSESARNIQRDVSTAFNDIGKQVQNTFHSVWEKPEVRNLSERGQEAVSQVQQSQVVKDFQETLATGVSKLNEQLGVFIQRMQQATTEAGTESEKEKQGDGSLVQTIPIEEMDEASTSGDKPATGATVHLDPDKE